MKYAPNMLNAGNKIGTINNAFSDAFKLKSGREKVRFLFVQYAVRINEIAAILNEINKKIVDSGDS